jgi:Glycosyl hydrolase family 115
MRQLLTTLLLALAGLAHAGLDVSTRATATSLPLDGAVIVGSTNADPLEAFVAQDLADDLKRLGLRTGAKGPVQIWVGTVGRHAAIDAAGLDLSKLKGCWECFQIAQLRNPAPGVSHALVIVGADRRGTAYGVYTLSQALGVSPWHWWADVAPLKRGPLHVSLSQPLHDGPVVKYRGLFINDEDWGLFPWAANTFEPEAGNIGPRTYEQVFRLLLRLKANTLWPAMHQVSGAFNANPQNGKPGNAELAQRYGIVMGSSHAEPMLRNNVAEWKAPAGQYNYATHPEQVRDYWAERLKTNGRYESLFTLGMRGIHDSGMQGGGSVAEKQALLNRLIADQRELLAKHVGDPMTLPQVFVPYKEVLPLLPGLALPDDVTLVWPDDNFGYIRQFPDAAQSKRSGGSGVYYHLSYLGAPLSYLWLSTTPPALVAEEMGRAFDAGVQRLWVANAGDIKPHEVNLNHWFDLAWNPAAVRAQGQAAYLRNLAERLFGVAEIADIWDGYYRVNFERRPEHLQFHLPGERMRRSGLAPAAVDERLGRFARLLTALEAVRPRIAAAQRDGFFQLVEYPLRASALANERFFALERYAATMERDPAGARRFAAQAVRADQRLKALTARYNGGRWAGILAEEPADGLWTSYRQLAPLLPAAGLGGRATDALTDLAKATADLAPVAATDAPPALRVTASEGWRRVTGLGRGEGVLSAQQPGATLELQTEAPAGPSCLRVHVLPTYPLTAGDPWQADLLVDGQTHALRWPRGLQDAAWGQGVLANRLPATLTLTDRAAGPLRLQLKAAQRDLMIDGAELLPGACKGNP